MTPKQKRARRAKLFRKYSNNLQSLKKDPSKFRIEPDINPSIVCPICTRVFIEESLEQEGENQNPLTLEDVPPRSLGGAPTILTCKECNNTSGSKLDAQLYNALLEKDSDKFLPNSSSNVTIRNQDSIIRGKIEVDADLGISLQYHQKRSHPRHFEKLKEISPNSRGFSITKPSVKLTKNQFEQLRNQKNIIHVKMESTLDSRLTNIALLRVAFLKMFEMFGHGVLFNEPMLSLADQIQKPDSEIIQGDFIIRHAFDESMAGVHLVTSPKELQGFLVVFKLTTPSISRWYGVMLPGFSEPGLNIYKFLQETYTGEGMWELDIESIPMKSEGVLEDPENVWRLLMIWAKLKREM